MKIEYFLNEMIEKIEMSKLEFLLYELENLNIDADIDWIIKILYNFCVRRWIFCITTAFT